MNNAFLAKSISFTIHKKNKIQPDSKQAIGYREGVVDANERIFPIYPENHEYMSGWFFGWGYMCAQANLLPCIKEEEYFLGYEQAQEQRSSDSREPDVRYAVAV